MYVICDWTGRNIFPGRTFPTFQDGWGFVCENVKDESSWEDIYVQRSPQTEGA